MPLTRAGEKLVQVIHTQSGAVATGTTIIPYDDTIPQNTEGDEYLTVTITPKSASNILYIEAIWQGSSSELATNLISAAIFQDSTANALAAITMRSLLASGDLIIPIRHRMVAGTTASTTFKLRVGGGDTGTTTMNGTSGARRFGGVMASSMTVIEVTP